MDEEDLRQPGDIEMLEAHARMIHRRFDTVQIVCTRHIDKFGTQRMQAGVGNVYARIESLDEFVRECRRE